MKKNLMALEAKVNEQGIIIQNQQHEITWLRKKCTASHPKRREKRNVDIPIPRSCAEYLQSNPSLPSGTYSIDPDGHGTGDPPFEVECNMTTGRLI